MFRGPQKQLPFLVVATGSLVALVHLQARTLAAVGVHPAWMLVAQALVAGGALWLLAFRAGRPALDGRHQRFYLLAGLTGLTLPNLAGFALLQRIDAATYALLVVLAPLLTWMLASLLERRPVQIRRLFGVVVGLAGALIVLIPALDQSGAEVATPSMLALGMTVPLLIAVGNLYRARAVPRSTPSLSLGGGTLLFQLPIALLLAIVLPGAELPPPERLAGLFGLGLLTLAAYLPFYQLQKQADAVAFSHIGYVILMVSAVGSAALLQAPLPTGWPLAAALVVLALVLNHPRTDLNASSCQRPVPPTHSSKEI